MHTVYSKDDVLHLLDTLLDVRQGPWWDDFFTDRDKSCPFFIQAPDENLVEFFETGQFTPGKVLEIGCGNGRNALYFAKKKCDVDALDFSQTAIDWAKENAKKAQLAINFMCASLFDVKLEPDAYDIVYDCGCFHHISPHRRQTYVETIARTIHPNGYFALVCFTSDGGSQLSDLEVYEKRTLKGGLGYSQEQIELIFSEHFEQISIRRMREEKSEDSSCFGRDFLWVVLMKPKAMHSQEKS